MDDIRYLSELNRAQLVQLAREVFGREKAAAFSLSPVTDHQIREELQQLNSERLQGAIAAMQGDW
ncbi:MAG TPA: hypothetical protein VKP88_03985 [Candidatus Paceibacterota bacterium]|nr:hypothetical protein [Candidatus Paceibacterota bacterium]